ncbi:unknown [Clostridium sp. CAG:440]|nr:unknown [Clostridium sp. CAG:440]
MKRKNEEEIDMKIFRDLLNRLINDNKITFSFYNKSLLDLDLLQICYNKTKDTIELEFRDVLEEHLEELKEIMDKKE